MALIYGVKQTLRIYENLSHRNKYVPGGDNNAFFVLSPTDMLPPFQIKREPDVYPLVSIKLIDDKTNAFVEDILQYVDSGDLEIFSFAEYDYIVHYGQLLLTVDIEPGKYYLEISDSIKTWYTETIYFKPFDANLLAPCAPTKLVFWDTCDIGDIFYRTAQFGSKQYKSILYLDIDIGQPIYINREEGDEDPYGNVTLEYVVAEKQYLLQGVFPQYITDVLNLVAPHLLRGIVEITTLRGYTEQVFKLTFDPKWQGQDKAIALTDIIITTEQVVVTACCDNLEEPFVTCLKDAYEVVSLQIEGTDNYDNFEYTDAETGEQVTLVHGNRVLTKMVSGAIYYRSVNLTGPGAPVYTPAAIFYDGAGIVNMNQYNIGSGIIYYYFKASAGRFYSKPDITSIAVPLVINNPNERVIKGSAWKNCLIEIWENISGTHVKVGTGTGTQFITAGIAYAHNPNASITYIKCRGLNCLLGQSVNWYWSEEGPSENPPSGIGAMAVGITFIVGDAATDEEPEDGF